MLPRAPLFCSRNSLFAMALLLLLLLPGQRMSAQAGREWALGSGHSLKGCGLFLEWDRRQEGREFSRAGVRLDFDAVLTGETARPGYNVHYQKCFMTRLSDRKDGTQTYFYYGPGLCFGSVRDQRGSRGPVIGLSGTLGFRLRFPSSPVTLSAALTTELGLHLQQVAGANNNILRFYQNGLLRSWMPEILITYQLP